MNNAIDKKTVPAVAGQRAGHSTRLLDLRSLMSLALERRLADRFVPELRRELFDSLAAATSNRVCLYGGLLAIDLREPRRELATSLTNCAARATSSSSSIPTFWEEALSFGARVFRSIWSRRFFGRDRARGTCSRVTRA